MSVYSSLADSGFNLLTLLLAIPLLGTLSMFLVPVNDERKARFIASLFGAAAFAVSIVMLASFDNDTAHFQLAEQKAWLPAWGITYTLAIDGLSMWMIVLTTFLSLLVLIASESVHKKLRSYLGLMLLLEAGMLGTFMALDGVLFYIFWELMLIPMYFLIGVWGGTRRVYAAIKFVLYTAFGSLLMLVAIAYLSYKCSIQLGQWSFFLGDWVQLNLSRSEELWLFAAFALAFAIKIPLFPFHTWLPDAHVEAPTGGSVILAGVMLKMGLYGLIRFGIPVFPHAALEAAPLFALLAVIGIVYGALVAWVQTDMKKLVAYSSVSHLGFCVLGFASMNFQGMQGCIVQMINHGISTGALFLLVGVLYDRKHTRLIADYGGIAGKLPTFSFVFLIFTLSSIGLPLTNGFVGEFPILLGAFRYDPLLGAIAVSGVVFGAMYMLSLYRRVSFGELDEQKNGDLTDLTLTEKVVFAPLLILVFLIGLHPQPIFDGVAHSAEVVIAQVDAVRAAQNTDSVARRRPTRSARVEVPVKKVP
ncbi:MAG: NADH-quinone oxidoreductase subunit M [Deltaproteobacteria bacterium]|nr:NADH-quinone oxidoreductase subunit M [Deltaproteobacteria bacterium]